MLAVEAVAPSARGYRPEHFAPANVVEKAIQIVGGRPSVLAYEISNVAGRTISRQTVNGWRMRGIFPKDVMLPVHQVTKIPLDELIRAQPKERPKASPVERALEIFDGSASRFAAALSEKTGRKITRQHVANWRSIEAFPRNVVLEVHELTKIPIEVLLRKPGRE